MLRLKEINYEDWVRVWSNCKKSNLLQSWEYGNAKENIENWIPHRFALIDNIGQDIGLVQVLLKKNPFIGNFARVNRGPIITIEVDDKYKKELILETIKLLKVESKNRKWRILQIAPELENSIEIINELKNFRLSHLSNEPWASGTFPLNMNDDDLIMQLNGKWRNCLRKGLKSNISLKYSNNCNEDLNLLFESYAMLKQKKQFSGMTESFIKDLSKQDNDNWKFNLFFAFEDSLQKKDPIGTLVSIFHGDTSIYLIGTSNSIGRKINANYVLLWEAVLKAKSQGSNWFDIGGLNKETPLGISHFKKGINSNLYQLVGEFRLINFFF